MATIRCGLHQLGEQTVRQRHKEDGLVETLCREREAGGQDALLVQAA